MSFWMYHGLTHSVYPVPAHTIEEVAILADKLKNRLYFEAELTTQPVDDSVEWWVKRRIAEDDDWKWFFFEEEAKAFAEEHGGELYVKQFREAEFFLVKQEI